MRVAALLACALLAGCASVEVRLPVYEDVDVPSAGVFRAGAARVDITPPPGYPMAGYSRIGTFARGHWLRLHARAIFLEDSEGRRLALVANDLWALPRGLHDRVVELLAADAGLRASLGRPLRPAEVLLAATHTHQSPGAYAPDAFFSETSGPAGGFDRAMFEFLARRIAAAIVSAHARLTPAVPRFASATLDGAVRNRSFEAFLRNPEADAVIAENAGLAPCSEAGYDAQACRAVDARLRMLRLDDAVSGAPLAAALFLAAHPTVVDHRSPLYSSDVFGALARRAERTLRDEAQKSERTSRDETGQATANAYVPASNRDGGIERASAASAEDPVVAVFNGAQGDVSFRWQTQDRGELARLTAVVANTARDLLVTPAGATAEAGSLDGLESPALSSSLDLFSLRHRRVRRADGSFARTARTPMAGRGTVVGAEDGRSGYPPCISHEGKRGLDFGAHGAKIGAFDLVEVGGFVVPPFWPTRLIFRLMPPEREVAVSLHRIGPLVLATLPGEFTTVLGRRIRAAVAARTGVAETNVVAVGLAQSYAYYFATPEEYDVQHYEGSGTLWGRESGAYVAERLGRLSGAPPSDDRACTSERGGARERRTCGARRYAAGRARTFGARRIDVAPDVLDGSLDYVLGTRVAISQASETDAGLRGPPRWCWSEPAVDLARVTDASADVTPRVAIEVRESDGWRAFAYEGALQDDTGLDLLSLAGPPNDAGRVCWCSYWTSPAGADPQAHYRFAVTPASAKHACEEPALCSPGFTLSSDAPHASCPGEPGR